MRHFRETWYKHKASSDNVDRTRTVTLPLVLQILIYKWHLLKNYFLETWCKYKALSDDMQRLSVLTPSTVSTELYSCVICDRPSIESRKENPQKLTQLSSRSHPRHLVGKRTAQKDTIIDITSDSQVNSNFPYRWSTASLTFNNYFYLFLYVYIT